MADTKPSLTNPEEDDADIEDLLTDTTKEEKSNDNNEKSLKDAMDKLSGKNNQKDDTMIHLLPSKTAAFNICELIFAYISLFILNRPKQCSAFVGISLLVIVVVVNLTLKNASDGASPENIIEHDYSEIKSQYEMNIGKVDHWCLQGGDQHCRCEDPLRSVKKGGFPAWEKAFKKNVDSIDEAIFNDDEAELDVVFLGENIVEYWSGSSLSFNSTFVHNVSRAFNKQFKGDSKIRGLPLGIAGDTTSNVLWRIQNGEMPDYLNPKIWWIVLGTNDLAMKQCSEEVVLMGILRVIEEILEQKPDAKIVVNSILPMSSDIKGRVPRIVKKDRKKVHTNSLGHDLGFRRRLAKKDKKKKEEDDGIGQEGKLTPGQTEIKAIKERMKPGKLPVVRLRRGPLRWVAVSMWPSVEAINYGLQKFAVKHKRVSFFNAYDIFVEEEDKESTPHIIKDLTKSFAIGQPSVAGHKELLKGINQRLRNMLNVMQKKGKAEKKFDDGEKEAKKEEEEKKEKKKDEKKEKKDDEKKEKKDEKKEKKEKKEKADEKNEKKEKNEKD